VGRREKESMKKERFNFIDKSGGWLG